MKHFPTFTLYDHHEPGSKPIDALTHDELARITDWSRTDEIVYKTPLIKLKSQLAAADIKTSKQFMHLQPKAEYYLTPHIKIN